MRVYCRIHIKPSQIYVTLPTLHPIFPKHPHNRFIMATSNDIDPGIEDLLKVGAPSNCTAERIDFAKTALPEYSDRFALLIHNLLTPAECSSFLAAAQSTTGDVWEQAMLNIGGGRQMLATEQRNCGRIIWDEETVAARLLDRIIPHLPDEIITLNNKAGITGNGPARREETWRISRANERLRFLKYTHGMYFREHCDGSYVTPDGKEISWLTVHLYLNGGRVEPEQDHDNNTGKAPEEGVTQEVLKGGSTRFFSMNLNRVVDVIPKTGMCLVFQHRGLVHSGEDVLSGKDGCLV